MRQQIPLCGQQAKIMHEFYSKGPMKVIYTKAQRKKIWGRTKTSSFPQYVMDEFAQKCPALYHRIVQHNQTGENIQSAVFSECAYAQTLANLFGLTIFRNCDEDASFLPRTVKSLLASYSLKARYAYCKDDYSRMLIQAGGCCGVDSALITVIGLDIFTIEFKEPSAKSSEPDLPKYGEDGVLRVTPQFLEKNPQFEPMLNEQKALNFFDVMGSNIHNFSYESVNTAIVCNYAAKKFADVICTEDKAGFLVMLPANQVPIWARIEGEIRPAGRNPYPVWTPQALQRFLIEKGAIINGDHIQMKMDSLTPTKPRGGLGISRYKINPIFFVRACDAIQNGINIEFDLSKVNQLNPTIAGKMFFDDLHYSEVQAHYRES